jgi:hypothetical protein
MNTFGWDTVYVVNIAKANNALAARKDQLIISFETSEVDQIQVKAKGQFSRWEIVEGGSGSILHLKLWIGEGNLEINLTQPKSVSLVGTSLVVAVQLQLLPSQIQRTEDLRFHITRVGQQGQPPQPGAIAPVALHDNSGQLTLAERALLQAALLDYIVANAQKISFVFATINLVPPSTNSWLTPVRSAYAYANRIGGSGALAILSVTTNRNISNLPLQIDNTALSPNYDATYAISSELFLRHVLMPTLPSAFRSGTTLSSFAMRNNAIINTRNIGMNGIKYGLTTYYPEITELSIQTNGSGLFSTYKGYVDMYYGIKMTFSVRTDNKVVFNRSTKTIAFQPDPNPSSSHSVDIPWYLYFLGLIVVAVIQILVKVISDDIANSLTRDIGEKISIIRNPPTSIQWTETRALDVQNADIKFAFYMQGNLPRN